MTKLEIAFTEAAKLSQAEQDALADWILEELASEKRWNELFARSESGLAKLAEDALTEYRSDETQPLDPDDL